MFYILCVFLLGFGYHGCPDWFQQDRSDVKHRQTRTDATNQTLDELFKMTKKLARTQRAWIQSGDSMGARVSISVEKKNTKLQQFISKLDLQDMLDPRESFFGGRTNAIKLHYKAEEDESIQH